MKKILFAIICIALMVCSCSKDDPLNPIDTNSPTEGEYGIISVVNNNHEVQYDGLAGALILEDLIVLMANKKEDKAIRIGFIGKMSNDSIRNNLTGEYLGSFDKNKKSLIINYIDSKKDLYIIELKKDLYKKMNGEKTNQTCVKIGCKNSTDKGSLFCGNHHGSYDFQIQIPGL